MKKLLLGLLLAITLAIGGGGNFAQAIEETKVLKGPEAIAPVTVPEQAPDFMLWPGQMLGMEQFENGRVIGVVEVSNQDKVFVVVLLLREPDGSIHVVSAQVTYFAAEFFNGAADPKHIKTEFYVDPDFLATGKPSDKLIRVDKALSIEQIIEATKKGLPRSF